LNKSVLEWYRRGEEILSDRARLTMEIEILRDAVKSYYSDFPDDALTGTKPIKLVDDKNGGFTIVGYSKSYQFAVLGERSVITITPPLTRTTANKYSLSKISSVKGDSSHTLVVAKTGDNTNRDDTFQAVLENITLELLPRR